MAGKTRKYLPRRVPALLLAAAVNLSLAACTPGPGASTSPSEPDETTMTGAPTGEETDMASMEPAGDSDRTSDEIATEMLAIVKDLMSYTGGDYTYFDETPFDPADTAGYPGEGCTGQQGSSINVDVSGPPAADIEAVEQKVVDAYTARGWEVILREETQLPQGKIMDVSFADPTGKQFGFGLGPNATTITMSSECSTHPSLDEPST